MSLTDTLIHSVALIVLVVAYTIVTVTGHDGTPLLGVIAGYVGGAGLQSASDRRKNGA